MNKKLLRKVRAMAEKRGLEDKLVSQHNQFGGFRYFNPYRNFIKTWIKNQLKVNGK
jgi:hypothetical protein